MVNHLRLRVRDRVNTSQRTQQPTQRRAVPLQIGDAVLEKLHHRGRHKIQDRYNSQPAIVDGIPPPEGGYFTITYPDGRKKNVSGSQLRKFHPGAAESPAREDRVPPREAPVEVTRYQYLEATYQVAPEVLEAAVPGDNVLRRSSRTRQAPVRLLHEI